MDCFLRLATLEVDPELPGALLYPKLKRPLGWTSKEALSLFIVLLRKEKLQVELGKVVRDRRVVLVLSLVRGHILLSERDSQLERDGGASTSKPLLRVHVEALHLRKRERWLLKRCSHSCRHFGSLSEPVIVQRSLIQGESELLVVRVLPLEVLHQLQVLVHEELALGHARHGPLERVKQVVVHGLTLFDGS